MNDVAPIIGVVFLGLSILDGIGVGIWYLVVRWNGALPPYARNDPDFGGMDFCGEWTGDQVSFEPAETTICVLIPGDRFGPYNLAREAFLELRRRYSEVQPGIARLLNEQREFHPPSKPFDNPLDVFNEAKLTHVTVRFTSETGLSPIEFELGFEVAWDPHNYDVLLREWAPVHVAVHG